MHHHLERNDTKKRLKIIVGNNYTILVLGSIIAPWQVGNKFAITACVKCIAVLPTTVSIIVVVKDRFPLDALQLALHYCCGPAESRRHRHQLL